MKLNECPLCKGTLELNQDSITHYRISPKGRITADTTTPTDNRWLECEDCQETSESSSELNKRLKEIDRLNR